MLLQRLLKLRHDNGLPLVKLYGPANTKDRGGTFLINFFDVYGQQYPFQYIEQQANEEMISLRSGCFCNPGIDELNNCLTADELKKYFTSRDYGDYDDMTQFLGKMRGAVRISIGMPTTKNDINKFICFAKKFLDMEVPLTGLDLSLILSNISNENSNRGVKFR